MQKLENRLSGWAVGLLVYTLAINQMIQRAIKTIPYQMVFGKEMRRYKILLVAMRERAQVEKEVIKKDILKMSETEKQLLLNQIKEWRFDTIDENHNSS